MRDVTAFLGLICRVALIAALSLAIGCGEDTSGGESGVMVEDAIAPTVSFVGLTEGQTVAGELEIEVIASDNDAVVEVSLEIDGEARTPISEEPYRWNWNATGVSFEAHTLRAIAKDAAGNTGAAQVTVEVVRFCPGYDCPPEDLLFISPEDGASVNGTVDVEVTATDDLEISSLSVDVSGVTLGSGDMAPLMTTWSTDELEEGVYTLRAVVTDSGDQSVEATIEVAVDRTRPEVDLLLPEDRTVVSDNVFCEAEVSDNIGVASVQFGVLGSTASLVLQQEPWEATLDVSSLPAGEYTLLATVRDRASQSRQDARTIIVDRPPVVVFVSPAPESSVREQIEVLIDANDDVELTRVELYANSTYVGEFDAEGYLNWTPSEAQDPGTPATLRAVAYDNREQMSVVEMNVIVDIDPCDRDGDGARADSEDCGGGDCDDDDTAFSPLNEDTVSDEIDQNCDGVDGVDSDGDTYASLDSGGADCDDDDEAVFPCPFDPPGICTDRTSDRRSCGACGQACDVGLSCVDSSCTCTADECVEGDPEGYDFDVPATFFDRISLSLSETDGFDFDGDDENDNALGPLMSALSQFFGGSINGELLQQINLGTLALGAIWPTLPTDGQTLSGEADVRVDVIPLLDVDDNPSTRDRYLASPEGFLSGYQTPRSRFLGGTVEGSNLSIGPAEAFFISLPIQGVLLRLELTEARMTGIVSRDTLGVRLSNGRLGGVLTMEKFAEAVNDYLQSEDCDCLTLDGPMIDLRVEDSCVGEYNTDACSGQGQGLCTAIAINCDLFLTLVDSSLDLDMDGDGDFDAISAMMRLSGPGTVVEGLGELPVEEEGE